MARKNCQSSSLDHVIYPYMDHVIYPYMDHVIYPYVDHVIYPYVSMNVSCLDLSCLNFYLYCLESELFYSSLSDTAFYRSSKKNFGHSIRYAKSYANSDFNSKQNKNKRVNNLVCLSFMDKIKSQIFTLKIKKTDENKEVNYVPSVQSKNS